MNLAKIIEQISSGNASQLPIVLDGYRLDDYIYDEGVMAFFEAIRDGNAPQGLSIDFRNNKISDRGAKYIAYILKSGNTPEGLTISLRNNEIGPAGARAIADAIKSGNAPKGLSIDLGCNDVVGPDGASAIADAIKSGNAPIGTKILGLGDEILMLCEKNDKLQKAKTMAAMATINNEQPKIIDDISEIIFNFARLPNFKGLSREEKKEAIENSDKSLRSFFDK